MNLASFILLHIGNGILSYIQIHPPFSRTSWRGPANLPSRFDYARDVRFQLILDWKPFDWWACLGTCVQK